MKPTTNTRRIDTEHTRNAAYTHINTYALMQSGEHHIQQTQAQSAMQRRPTTFTWHLVQHADARNTLGAIHTGHARNMHIPTHTPTPTHAPKLTQRRTRAHTRHTRTHQHPQSPTRASTHAPRRITYLDECMNEGRRTARTTSTTHTHTHQHTHEHTSTHAPTRAPTPTQRRTRDTPTPTPTHTSTNTKRVRTHNGTRRTRAQTPTPTPTHERHNDSTTHADKQTLNTNATTTQRREDANQFFFSNPLPNNVLPVRSKSVLMVNVTPSPGAHYKHLRTCTQQQYANPHKVIELRHNSSLPEKQNADNYGGN